MTATDVITAAVFAVAGIACGIVQFFLLRYAVNGALCRSRTWLLLLQPIIPLILLVASALISLKLLPFSAVGYTLALAIASGVNVIRQKNKGKD